MTSFSSFRRLLVVLALLPQVLFLGLGHGVVICVADGDQAPAEAAGEPCCGRAAPSDSHGAGGSAGIGCADRCHCCFELRVEPASIATKAPDRTDFGSQGQAVPVVLRGVPPIVRSCSPGRRLTAARDREPPYLLQLRGVVIRC